MSRTVRTRNNTLGSNIAAGILVGTKRYQEKRLAEKHLELQRQELALKEREAALQEREQVLQNIKLSKEALGINSAFEQGSALQAGAERAGVHKLGGMTGAYAPQGYGAPQGPGLSTQMNAYQKVLGGEEESDYDKQMKAIKLRQAQIGLEKDEHDRATGWMSPEQRKAAERKAAWFPDDPNQSKIYEPLLAAVQSVANEGSNPMHADFPSKLWEAVSAKLKEMEGTVTPDTVAEAVQYVVKNMQAFGGFTPEKKINFWPDQQSQYTPPDRSAHTRTAADYVQELLPGE